jgi:hypothetical protein
MADEAKKSGSAVVYVVTHGHKGDEFNAGMTYLGFAEVHPLRDYLPKNPKNVVTGIGKRQDDVAKALGLIPNFKAEWAGNGDSLIVRGGEKFILRANGTEEKSEGGNFTPEEISAALAGILSLEDDTVVCAGRPLMLMLGFDKALATSASVFGIEIRDGIIVDIRRFTCNDGVVDPALS